MQIVDDEFLEKQVARPQQESAKYLIIVAIGWQVAAFIVGLVLSALAGAVTALYRLPMHPSRVNLYGYLAALGISITLLLAA